MGAPVAEITVEAEKMWIEAIEILSESVAYDEAELAEAGKAPEPFSSSKTSNWVARVGGLPTFIQHVAHDIIESGKVTSVSHAIAIALSQAKKWAAKGNKEAAAAVAEWEAKRAKNAAKQVSEAEVVEWLEARLATVEAASPESPADEEASREETESVRSLVEALTEASGSSDESSPEEIEEAAPAAPASTVHVHLGGGTPEKSGDPKPGSEKEKQPAAATPDPQKAAPQGQPGPAQTPGTQPTPGLAELVLQPGMGRSDDRVSKLQSRLGELGYEVSQDGVYGDLTTKAVRDFQTAVGLDPTGIVDEGTVGALRAAQAPSAEDPIVTSVVRPGTAGEPVKRVQKALTGSGYDVGGEPSGSYDRQTEAAVKQFQREHGLKPDGIVGRHTGRVIDAVARSSRAQGRLAEAFEDRMNAKDGYEFCGALAREHAARAMLEACLADVHQHGYGGMPDAHPHGKPGKKKLKTDREKGPGEPDNEVSEANFREILHPRNRLGKFRDGPHSGLKWFETPRVAPNGLPRPLLPHGTNPSEPVSGKANFGLQLRSHQGGNFGVSPKVGQDGIPQAVGMEGLQPFHKARVGRVGEMQTKDLKVALAKAREYGSRSVQKKIGTELVKRGELKSMPDLVSGLRNPGSPMRSVPDTLTNFRAERRASLGKMSNADLDALVGRRADNDLPPYGDPEREWERRKGLPEGWSMTHHPDSLKMGRARLAVADSVGFGQAQREHVRGRLGITTPPEDLPHGTAKTTPDRKGAPLSRYESTIAAPPMVPAKRSPGVTERRARFPSLEQQIQALGVGRQTDLGNGVKVSRRTGGYTAEIDGHPIDLGRNNKAPSSVAGAVNRALSVKIAGGKANPGLPDRTSAAKAETPFERPLPELTLSQIGAIVDENWPKVNFAARPYLDAIKQMNSHTDAYGADRGDMIVAYFLSNATGWRGPVAKAVKAELRRRIGA